MADKASVIIHQADEVRTVPIDALFLEQRKVFLGGQVTAASSNKLVKELMYLAHLDGDAPITLYINSPGGSVVDGMAIYDTIQHISCPVHAVVAGMAASMGAVILSGCEKGHRTCLPSAEVLLHQPLGGLGGMATDVEIRARWLLRLKERLIRVLADNCGQDYDKVLADCDRDHWLDAHEANEYGIIDKVLQ